jgi:hypothetical protein
MSKVTIDDVIELLKRHNEARDADLTKIVLYTDLSGHFAKMGRKIGYDKEIKNSGFGGLCEAHEWLEKRIAKATKTKRPTLVKTLYEHYRVPLWPFELPETEGKYESLAYKEKNRPDERMLIRYEQHTRRFEPSIRGGKTICKLVLSNDDAIEGVAYCSMSDSFVYRTGREIARQRAMKAYCARYGES